jgi:hypothetical protein
VLQIAPNTSSMITNGSKNREAEVPSATNSTQHEFGNVKRSTVPKTRGPRVQITTGVRHDLDVDDRRISIQWLIHTYEDAVVHTREDEDILLAPNTSVTVPDLLIRDPTILSSLHSFQAYATATNTKTEIPISIS